MKGLRLVNLTKPGPARKPLAGRYRVADLRPALFLLATLLVALGLKLHYRNAAPGALVWILAPTAALVQAVSGVPFEYESGAGWISRAEGFVIAPPCAGINFLIISALSLSLILLVEKPRQCTLPWWLAAHLMAYIATLGINALRIALALKAPEVLPTAWLSPAEQHRWGGVLVYLAGLWLITRVWRWICIPRPENGRIARPQGFGVRGWVWIPPAVYLLVVLGVPLASAPWKGLAPNFVRHGVTVAAGCLFVWGGLFLLKRHLFCPRQGQAAAQAVSGRPAAGESTPTPESAHGRYHSHCRR